MDAKRQMKLFRDTFGEELTGDVYCACGEYFRGPKRGIYMNGTAYVFDCKCMRYMQLEAFIRENWVKVASYIGTVNTAENSMERAYARGSYRGIQLTGPLCAHLDDDEEKG